MPEMAREYLSEALRNFNECEMNGFIKQAKDAFESLK